MGDERESWREANHQTDATATLNKTGVDAIITAFYNWSSSTRFNNDHFLINEDKLYYAYLFTM